MVTSSIVLVTEGRWRRVPAGRKPFRFARREALTAYPGMPARLYVAHLTFRRRARRRRVGHIARRRRRRTAATRRLFSALLALFPAANPCASGRFFRWRVSLKHPRRPATTSAIPPTTATPRPSAPLTAPPLATPAPSLTWIPPRHLRPAAWAACSSATYSDLVRPHLGLSSAARQARTRRRAGRHPPARRSHHLPQPLRPSRRPDPPPHRYHTDPLRHAPRQRAVPARRPASTRSLELDWWQSHQVRRPPHSPRFPPLRSMRAPWNRNEALWGGFVFRRARGRRLPLGYTALFDGFADIGDYRAHRTGNVADWGLRAALVHGGAAHESVRTRSGLRRSGRARHLVVHARG